MMIFGKLLGAKYGVKAVSPSGGGRIGQARLRKRVGAREEKAGKWLWCTENFKAFARSKTVAVIGQLNLGF